LIYWNKEDCAIGTPSEEDWNSGVLEYWIPITIGRNGGIME